MSEPQPKPTAAWAQRPGETFAEYLERYHEELETPQARARGEELARMDREDGPPGDVVDAPVDDPER